MTNPGKVYPFFVTAYTPKGFRSLAQKALVGIDNLFVLQGSARRAKTRIIGQIGESLLEQGCDVELLRSSIHSTLLEGLIVPALHTAVVDGPACLIREARGRGVEVNLTKYCDQHKLQSQQAEIESIESEIKAHLARVVDYTRESKRLHEKVEQHYARGLDFAKADVKAETLLTEILAGVGKRPAEPLVRSFFAVAWIPDIESMVDLRLKTTDDCRTRYILKGRPGTGKATLARKIANAAIERGYDTDLHICPFDPDPGSLDGIVIPALSTAILDGTPGHVLEPERPGDKIVDMLECVDLKQVDLQAIQTLQNQKPDSETNGCKSLMAAAEAGERLESFYAESLDDTAIKEVILDLTERIESIVFNDQSAQS